MNEIVSEHGKVKKINDKALSTLKTKLQKIKPVIALSASAIIFFSGLAIGKASTNTEEKTNPVSVSDNQILTNISVDVFSGDTVSEIADEFYNEDYDSVYGSKENFIKSIEETNGIVDSKITSGSRIKIPVIIDEDNPSLQNYVSKQMELFELEENEKWVKYTVKLDDNITSLAAFGSAANYVGVNEEEAQEIIKRNNLPSNTIYAGQELWIINPKIGELKLEVKEANKELIESLKSNTKTK